MKVKEKINSLLKKNLRIPFQFLFRIMPIRSYMLNREEKTCIILVEKYKMKIKSKICIIYSFYALSKKRRMQRWIERKKFFFVFKIKICVRSVWLGMSEYLWLLFIIIIIITIMIIIVIIMTLWIKKNKLKHEENFK